MAVTKKIPELDPYGSVNKPAYLKDMYEVSRNMGTYNEPDYPAGSSRKISFEQLIQNLGYLPYSGFNYEIVQNTGFYLNDGDAFIAALAKCKAKTPGGLPLSEDNRAVIYLLPGIYDIQTKQDIGEFVDIYGIGNAEHIIFQSSYGQTAIFNILTTNDYSFSNFTINNYSRSSISHSGTTDNGKWNNLILKSKTTKNIDYSGIYESITGTAEYVLAGSISGVVRRSNFYRYSCGYGEGFDCIVSGLIEDCTADRWSFCFANTFNDRAVISGVIRRCKGNVRCFGFAQTEGNSILSGILEDCEITDQLFAATTSVGKMIRCKTSQVWYPQAGSMIDCNFSGPIPNLVLKDGSKLIRTTVITSGAFGAIETETGATVTIYQCVTNVDINSYSGNAYTNTINTAYNVIDSNIDG